MPEVLVIETAYWSLSVWTKEIEKPRKQLLATHQARGNPLPETSLRFSPALADPIVRNETTEIPVFDTQENIQLPEPVFFENRIYEFEFLFPKEVTDSCKPAIIHPSLSMESSFRLTRDSLRGGINFGNDIGWFRFGIVFRAEEKEITQYLSFEVLPLKMDLQHDFRIIHAEIDRFYPLWRFSIAKKTVQEFNLQRRPHEYFPLLWLSLFNTFRIELLSAVKVIVRSPHSRLMPIIRHARPESIRGRINAPLAEKIRAGILQKDKPSRYRILEHRLSVNTPENRFVKMVLTQCNRKLKEFKKKAVDANASYGYERLSDSFFREIDLWQTALTQRLTDPLFREVGDDYDGMRYESIVLHHKTGYAKVYKIWQQLKLYMEFFGRESEISVKSVAELYEIWCLLEIRRLLNEIGFEEEMFRAADLITSGVEKHLKNGQGTAFNFTRSDGIKIRLAHEPLFPVNREQPHREIISWTTPQKPDILLEAEFTDGGKIFWIFDAKYRIDPENRNHDSIPDDAINQMHRYRDALIHINAKPDGRTPQSRPVIGAFVLYPGLFAEKTGTNPYFTAINAVGIGGFPLLPGRENVWLKEFLTEKFSDPKISSLYRRPDTDDFLLHESVRIPPTGLTLSRYSDLTLVAMAKNKAPEYNKRFRNGTARWYHMPVETYDRKLPGEKTIREIRHCAIYMYDPETKKRNLEFIYDVQSVKKICRSELSEEQAGDTEKNNNGNYWLFELGPSRRREMPLDLPGARFLLTGLTDILRANDWNELSNRHQVSS